MAVQVRELEGQDMREVIQDRINAWFVENRNNETGEYPDFPEQDEGGSKVCGVYALCVVGMGAGVGVSTSVRVGASGTVVA